jgi:hypothetical protein
MKYSWPCRSRSIVTTVKSTRLLRAKHTRHRNAYRIFVVNCLENGHFEDSIRLEVKSATDGREVDFEDKGECN